MKPDLLERLRGDLDGADYRTDAVVALLGATADAARQRGVFAPARFVLDGRDPSPLTTLIRLFLLGERASDAALDAALPSVRAAGAAELGLVVRDAGSAADAAVPTYRAALSLNPVRIDAAGSPHSTDWWILSDLDDQLRRGPARTDHVMGVGGATRSLLAQAPLAPARASNPAAASDLETALRFGTALDLGTGCGIVALVLAREGAQRVVATDISERALMLARANARLNGLDERIVFRQGNLFEPVAGERFDLILSNPPFVITPRGTDDGDGDADAPVYEYRDGGLVGDALAAAVVRQGPAHLEPGGTLLCLANWESPWGENGLERVRGWIADAAEVADAAEPAEQVGELAGWVMERDRVDPVQYAETWARDGGARPGEAAFEELMEAWLRDFARRRIVAVGLGSIRIRRLRALEAATAGSAAVAGSAAEVGAAVEHPAGSPDRIHLDRAAGAFATDNLGGALETAFAAGIALQGLGDAGVLATRWVLDGAVREEREHAPGEESPRSIVLCTDRPVARRVTADTLLAAAMGACDGELTLAQIAGALATLLEVDADAAAEALVAGVRELVWLGMLAPAGQPGQVSRSLE